MTGVHSLIEGLRLPLFSVRLAFVPGHLTCRSIVLMTGSNKREPRPVVGGLEGSKRPPFPKRKVAILMGYCGSNYQGMQLYGSK